MRVNEKLSCSLSSNERTGREAALRFLLPSASRWRLTVSISFPLSSPFFFFPFCPHPWQTFVTRMDAVIKKTFSLTRCLFQRTTRRGGAGFRRPRLLQLARVSAHTFTKAPFSCRRGSDILLSQLNLPLYF